jgi:hypothetical protein
MSKKSPPKRGFPFLGNQSITSAVFNLAFSPEGYASAMATQLGPDNESADENIRLTHFPTDSMLF